MTKKTLENVGLWLATGIAGLGALGFGINALTTLIEHPENTGELYGMATAAAVLAFITSHLRSVIRERADRDRTLSLAHLRPAAALGEGAPAWGAGSAPSAEPVAVRLERDCPHCAERILVAAKLCKHCHSDVSGS